MQSWMIGIVLGIVSVGFWPALPGWPAPLMLACLAIFTLRWRPRAVRLVCGVACGCALAIVNGNVLLQNRLADNCVKLPLTLEGEVSSLPRTSRMWDDTVRQRFEFSVSGMSPSHCRGPSRLLLTYYGTHKISPGERWRFDVKLKKPWGLANPGSYNMQAWFAQSGIDGVGSVLGAGRAERLPPGNRLSTAHHRLRLDISEHIAGLDMERDVVAILQAITVADKTGIDARLWSLLQQFGVNHLLVISGLHVGLIAGAGYLLGGLCLRPLLWAGIAGAWLPGSLALVLACFYAALAGFSLATQRALCMLACFIVANLAGRSSSPANNLLLAAVMVLVVNPLAALGSGFWLSFGAVAALLWLARWQRGVGKFRRVLSTHGFMSLVMLPLGAWWFGGSSLVAMPANLLMIPLVGFVVVPLALLAVAGYLCGWPFESGLWQLAAWPLRQLLPLADALADTGGAWLYYPMAPGLPGVLLGILAVTVLVLPGGPALKLLAVILALPMVLPLANKQEAPGLSTRVTVLDVGQGTAVVVRAGDRALLYDTGGGDPAGVNLGATVVLPYLRRQGVTALDTLVVSHPDLDHSAGAAGIVRAMAVDRLRYGGSPPGVPGGRPCAAGEAWRWPGGQLFQFLSPALETSLPSNDSSCVLQIQIGDYRLLLPGDIENDRERTLVRYWGNSLHNDWLLAAHHGSQTSSSRTLLKTVRPGTVVISSGYANRFGHPHPSVMRRLQQGDAQILSTAGSGALEFDFAPGKAVVIRAYRQEKQRFWM